MGEDGGDKPSIIFSDQSYPPDQRYPDQPHPDQPCPPDQRPQKPQMVDATVNTEEQQQRWKCSKCCFCFDTKNVKKATLFVATISSLCIVCNLLVKIAGYSEICWNFELLFLLVDGVAVASMCYGLCTQNAAYLQPFVVLSIITISLLMLLAAYLGTAMANPGSYASQELELELNKRLSDAAKQAKLELRFIVSLVATMAFFAMLFSVFVHIWFVYLTVQCAKHFRRNAVFSL